MIEYADAGECENRRCSGLVAGEEIFREDFGLGGDHAAVVVEMENDDPVENGVGPFGFGKDFCGIGAEGLEEFGNGAVMPANENLTAVGFGTKLLDEAGRFFVGESGIELEFQGGGEGFEGQTGALAAGGICGGEDGIGFEGLGIDGEVLEIIDVSPGALFTGGREGAALIGLLGVADDEDGGVAKAGGGVVIAGESKDGPEEEQD